MEGERAQGEKIVIAGLDKAGKSSIIQRVFFNAYPDDLETLEPTRGVGREPIKLTDKEIQYVFWELGGQQQYLTNHTSKPQIFSQTRLLIFVIDLQDDSRYETAIDYLTQLLTLLREMTSECHVTIILHKFDPNLSTELRKKQFVIFKLIKSVRSQYSNFNFSQHSTSIYDDSLFYTFQNIFERLGIDIGAYSQKITTQLTLKERPDKKTRTREIMSQELINKFDSILESSRSATEHLAPEFSELDGIDKVHKIMTKYISTFHEYESKDTKKKSIDALIMSYLEFIASLTKGALSDGKISEEEAQLVFLFMGQLNLLKVRYIHYVMKTEPYKIKNPLKFMEQLKKLTNDLLDATYIVSNISLEQLQELKQLLNGVSNKNFSLFAQDSQDVYTFTSIQELKSAFSQDRFVPAKMIIKIELAEQLKERYHQEVNQISENLGDDRQEEKDALSMYLTRLDYLILEFYQLVLEKDIKEYDIERIISNQFQSLSFQLLTIANLANIIGDQDRLHIRNIIETLR